MTEQPTYIAQVDQFEHNSCSLSNYFEHYQWFACWSPMAHVTGSTLHSLTM